MTRPLDHFNRIVCINLDDRPDRWAQMQQTTAPLLGSAPLERLPAVKPDLAQERVHNGRAGCLFSHRQAIETAYRDGLDNILVFEDDVRFAPDFNEQAEQAIASLKQTEWDLFYFGFTPQAPLLPAGDALARTYGGITTHAIAYHRRAMKQLLDWLPDEASVLAFLSKHKSVDRFYWRVVSPKMRCYATRPLLAFQRDDFSDIQQGQTVSNEQASKDAFEKHYIDRPSAMTGLKLHAGLAWNRLAHTVDGQRRALLKPIKAK